MYRAFLAIALLGFGLCSTPAFAQQAPSAPELPSVLRCVAYDGSTRYATKQVPGLTCTPLSQPSQPPVHAPESIAGGQRGEIYSFDIDGVHRFATSLPPGVAVQNLRVIRYTFIETCFACGASDSEFRRLRVNREAYAPEIHAAAQEFGVEEALIRSIAHAESAFVPDVISRAGAQGVMQLMPDTAQRFGVTNTLNPAQSIRGGTQYLAWLIHRYPGHLDYAVAAYNAGEGAVDRYQGIPPFPETQRYVRRVEQLLAAYRGQP